jgi:hypothetical protein
LPLQPQLPQHTLHPPNPSPGVGPVYPSSLPGASFPSDVSLRRGYVPQDYMESLRNKEYQVMAEWTHAAMRSRSTARKLRPDAPRLDPDLDVTFWLHAAFNVHGALRSLINGSPEGLWFASHAEQLLAHIRNIVDAHYEGCHWPRLLEYDRAVRQLKAENLSFDMSDDRVTLRTFHTLVLSPIHPSAHSSSSMHSNSASQSSPRRPQPSFSTPASPVRPPPLDMVCFRCGGIGHGSNRCPNPPLSRPPLADRGPDPRPAVDGADSRVCRPFNGRGCTRSSCSNAHVCILCYGDHTGSRCPSAGRR